MFARLPVPIVVSRGAFVPVAVFALIFMGLSGVSGAGALATVAVAGGLGGVLSLIVHELGHVSVARKLSGVRTEKVAVMSLGAAAHFDGSYRNGREQVRMALGGPEASFAFALALGAPIFLPAPLLLKVAVDFTVAVVLVAARPLIGVTVIALAAVALVQKQFVGRLKPSNE